MNHLLARIKGPEEEFLKVISSRNKIFDLPDLTNVQNYSPGYKLEEDEWYVLNNFSTLGFTNSLIGESFNSTNYNQILTTQYQNINYLCCKQGKLLLFQKMFPTQILNKKWFLISDPVIKKDPIIVLNHWVDAIYNTENNKLYFRDIARIKIMFKDIESLYRAATQIEVNDFLDNDFIALANNFSGDDVKTANRKRIAMITDRLNQLTSPQKKKILKYINSYCRDVPISGGVFQISTEEHLKKILHGIDERYYTTILDKEKRLANSILKLVS